MNKPLLEDALAHIVGCPELHNQNYYYEVTEFGISACFAGRALLLAGYEAALTSTQEGTRSSLAIHPVTRERVNVFNEARFITGIGHDWARNLFSCANTREMLERKVKDLLNGAPLEQYRELVLARA